jgi:2-polyprenyl-6-methoxyphenol hydroxylase-like FAD-dependent oxidoreductase
MSLPSSTTVLIVGAGPAGMACALSLWLSGVKDLVIVEGAEDRKGDLSSRAFVLHAATLEVRRREHCGHSLILQYTTTGTRSSRLCQFFDRTRDQAFHNELLRPLR